MTISWSPPEKSVSQIAFPPEVRAIDETTVLPGFP